MEPSVARKDHWFSFMMPVEISIFLRSLSRGTNEGPRVTKFDRFVMRDH